MKITTIAMLLLASTLPVQAAVYKWIDEQGNVHYSDEPNHPAAEKIHVAPAPTYTPGPLPEFQSQSEQQQPPALDENYSSLSISAPANDAVLWDTGNEVMISVSLQPALKTDLGHKLEFSLDGEPVGESTSTSYLITGIERGTHQITARVVNASGVALDSDSVTIHMRQRTITDAPGSGNPNLPSVPTAPRAPQAPRL